MQSASWTIVGTLKIGVSLTGACRHLGTVLRDSPVLRAISRSECFSLACSRRNLPICPW